MVGIRIEDEKGAIWTVYRKEYEIHDTVYGLLDDKGIETEKCMDAACWCELAVTDSHYENGNVAISVEEERINICINS